MNEETLNRLKKDLDAARLAAKRAADVVDDGGSCNLDAVVVPTGKSHPLKACSAKLDQVFGGKHRRFTARWSRGYMLSYAHGQAAKRTVAAEAAKVALQAWGAYVFYQVD